MASVPTFFSGIVASTLVPITNLNNATNYVSGPSGSAREFQVSTVGAEEFRGLINGQIFLTDGSLNTESATGRQMPNILEVKFAGPAFNIARQEERENEAARRNSELRLTFGSPQSPRKAARRTIPMTDDASCLLKLRVKKATKLGTPYLFRSRHDVQKPIGSVKKAHSAAVKRAKIQRYFRLYDLRHTFATRAVDAGTDLPTLSSLLGHASILMTMRYVHPAAEQRKTAMGKFEKFSAEGIISAATTQQSHRVPTKVTTLERVN